MFYYLLSEVLGFTYGVEENEDLVPEGAIIFPNEEALELAVDRASKDVEEEFLKFQEEADAAVPEDPKEEDDGKQDEEEGGFKREDYVQDLIDNKSATDGEERSALEDFLKKLDHDTIKNKHKVEKIRSLAGKLRINSPERLLENELCLAIDAKLFGE